MISSNGNSTNQKFNFLARNYNTLDYAPRLLELLKNTYPFENFDKCTKSDLHKVLNNALLENYKGEEIFKYRLFERYYNKPNIVGAFEIKVNNSRADFLIINGYTKSFEIKSELDNLAKVSKQADDYILAFEYNYLVVASRHIQKATEHLPKNFGLWSYKNGKYKQQQKADLNDKMNPEVQLRLLTQKERIKNFPETGGGIEEILARHDAHTINQLFKKALRARYRKRWEFLVTNEAEILPIDIQFFFNTNIRPDYIYF